MISNKNILTNYDIAYIIMPQVMRIHTQRGRKKPVEGVGSVERPTEGLLDDPVDTGADI